MPLNSFRDVQRFITEVMEQNKIAGAPPPESPHKAFWNSLSYEQFTTGSVPGVVEPATGLPIPILVKGDSLSSNIILALRGQGRLFDTNAGAFGRMPANGRKPFTDNQIRELADWIDAGCPE